MGFLISWQYSGSWFFYSRSSFGKSVPKRHSKKMLSKKKTRKRLFPKLNTMLNFLLSFQIPVQDGGHYFSEEAKKEKNLSRIESYFVVSFSWTNPKKENRRKDQKNNQTNNQTNNQSINQSTKQSNKQTIKQTTQ